MAKNVIKLMQKADALIAKARELENKEYAKLGKAVISMYKKDNLSSDNVENEIKKIFGEEMKNSSKKTLKNISENNSDNGVRIKVIKDDDFMK